MEDEYQLIIYPDRYEPEYKSLLAKLLTIQSLRESAEILDKSDPLSASFKKRISIMFCGLSSLSLLGGIEGKNPLPKSVANFISLVSNRNKIVDELNREGIVVDIKIMFAYPYSDFMYDLFQAEDTQQDGYSVDNIRQNATTNSEFKVTRKMALSDVTRFMTYQHLIRSLNRLQDAVIDGKEVFNHDKTSNRVIVKFTPLNVLTCLLKINNRLFIDPYLYSKQSPNSDHLLLNAPISAISIPCLVSTDDAENTEGKENRILDHFYSIVSHFKYLWHHPYTMYSTDATEFHKWRKSTLSIIKEPEQVSYLGKAMRLKEPNSKQYEIDLWKQYCKNGLLKYCSKFLEKGLVDHHQQGLSGISSIPPISIFIIGAWSGSGNKKSPSEFMRLIEAFITRYFASKTPGGLKLHPILVESEAGQHLQKALFHDLNSSQLGVVILTPDNTDGSPKPNVSLEWGYLMGRLGRKMGRSMDNKEKELVFIFSQDNSIGGSNVNHIIYTSFTDAVDFEVQFYKFIMWLWDITELDSDYAIHILEELKRDMHARKTTTMDHLIEIEKFIRVIKNWEDEYLTRMQQFKSKSP